MSCSRRIVLVCVLFCINVRHKWELTLVFILWYKFAFFSKTNNDIFIQKIFSFVVTLYPSTELTTSTKTLFPSAYTSPQNYLKGLVMSNLINHKYQEEDMLLGFSRFCYRFIHNIFESSFTEIEKTILNWLIILFSLLKFILFVSTNSDIFQDF